MTRYETTSSACTRRPDEIGANGFSSSSWPEQIPAARGGGGAQGRRRRLLERRGGGGYCLGSRTPQNPLRMLNTLSSVSVRESRIQYLCDPQWFRDTASLDPIASFSAIAYPVDMVSRRKKSRSSEAWQPGAKYPVDKETVVARSVVTKKRQQLSEQLLNNLLENIQTFNAINAQDGKNQWLK
ncbi:hypothetical protein F511_37313 [Dorcoceras hygrometricum]|uniref:Uncharacterized protein n=1 Tax=Dorcoceras hygrometricum TaxID=472368 RepID=A0A2Z7AY82_9LAMI|nr:hypothetical protein F511_37313 [Dorcoceras hygrometricum]